ncbi:hypothetical protein ACFWGD_05095 [Corynebacterium sp. NPDC060344]|uniref:hypothetical protein n=1 Tax=Corynebacterium sp. NPDC060344 TaxID=3347101 RepID=UPI0036560580
MDDSTHRSGIGAGSEPGPGPGAGRGREHDSTADVDFDALARSLSGGDASSVSVPLIVSGGVLVALLVLSLVYGWPVWAPILCVIGLVVLMGVAKLRRPPVAPLELTSSERDRVRRVIAEHGVRPAVALVRALYPGESSVAAVKTVRQVLERG